MSHSSATHLDMSTNNHHHSKARRLLAASVGEARGSHETVRCSQPLQETKATAPIAIRASVGANEYSPIVEEVRKVRVGRDKELGHRHHHRQHHHHHHRHRPEPAVDKAASTSSTNIRASSGKASTSTKDREASSNSSSPILPMDQAKESRRQLESVLAQLQTLRRTTNSRTGASNSNSTNAMPEEYDPVEQYRTRLNKLYSDSDIFRMHENLGPVSSGDSSFKTATGAGPSQPPSKRQSMLPFLDEDTNRILESGFDNGDELSSNTIGPAPSKRPVASSGSKRLSILSTNDTPVPTSPLPPLPGGSRATPLHLKTVLTAEPRLVSGHERKHQSVRASTSTVSNSPDFTFTSPLPSGSVHNNRRYENWNQNHSLARNDEDPLDDVAELHIPKRTSSHRPHSMFVTKDHVYETQGTAGRHVPLAGESSKQHRRPYSYHSEAPVSQTIVEERDEHEDTVPSRQQHKPHRHKHRHSRHCHPHAQSAPRDSKRSKSKMSLGSDMGATKSGAFSQPNIQRLMELADNTLQLEQLDIPPDELRLLDKFVNALSKLSVEINLDDRKRLEGKRRLHNALRAIEGWI